MTIKDNTLSLQSILDTVNNLPTSKSDADLIPENIKKDVEILGVTGSYEGVELNFEVVGGTTQPSNPTENMILVNTDVPITGYRFSSTEPENMNEGEVWIEVGTNSDVAFDIVNDVTVYPISAKQYVNGTWVDKAAKIYQGGEWVDWITELVIFEAGKGAVQAYATKKGAYEDSTITVSTSKIAVDGTDLVYYTKNKINTAGYKTLRLVGKFPGD